MSDECTTQLTIWSLLSRQNLLNPDATAAVCCDQMIQHLKGHREAFLTVQSQYNLFERWQIKLPLYILKKTPGTLSWVKSKELLLDPSDWEC